MKNESAQLPGIDPRVRQYMDPSPEVLQKALPALSNFANSFKFTPVEGALGKGHSKKRKYFWSDIDGVGLKKSSSSSSSSSGRSESDSIPSAIDAPFPPPSSSSDESKLAVGSVETIADFKRMIEHPLKAVSLLCPALTQMQTRIVEFVEEGETAAYYRKAVSCIIELRKACLKHGESDTFNEFLRGTIKVKFDDSDFWDMLVAEKITLISNAEDSAADATSTEANIFIGLEILSNLEESTSSVKTASTAAVTKSTAIDDKDDDDDDDDDDVNLLNMD